MKRNVGFIIGIVLLMAVVWTLTVIGRTVIFKDENTVFYYLKLSSSSPQGYLPATDVYSSCDAVIYNGVCVCKLDLRIYE